MKYKYSLETRVWEWGKTEKREENDPATLKVKMMNKL